MAQADSGGSSQTATSARSICALARLEHSALAPSSGAGLQLLLGILLALLLLLLDLLLDLLHLDLTCCSDRIAIFAGLLLPLLLGSVFAGLSKFRPKYICRTPFTKKENQKRRTKRKSTAVMDLDLGGGGAALGALALNLGDEVHALHHLAEDHVLAVEPRRLHRGHEELRAVGARARVGHGQETRARVLDLEVLVVELLTYVR